MLTPKSPGKPEEVWDIHPLTPLDDLFWPVDEVLVRWRDQEGAQIGGVEEDDELAVGAPDQQEKLSWTASLSDNRDIFAPWFHYRALGSGGELHSHTKK